MGKEFSSDMSAYFTVTNADRTGTMKTGAKRLEELRPETGKDRKYSVERERDKILNNL